MKEIKTSFLLPEELWRQAKIRAVNEGVSLGELIRKILADYLEKEESKGKGKKDK